MFYYLISMVALVGFLDHAGRRSRIELQLSQTRFKLYELRDKLRNTAIQGEIEQDNWFDYFDTTLTKMIDILPKLTVLQIILLIYHYRNDEGIRRSTQNLDEFLNAPANKFYKHLFDSYSSCVVNFLMSRHRVLGFAAKQSLKFTVKILLAKARASEVLATAPETSTFGNYCTG
jgi:hypothetical protein